MHRETVPVESGVRASGGGWFYQTGGGAQTCLSLRHVRTQPGAPGNYIRQLEAHGESGREPPERPNKDNQAQSLVTVLSKPKQRSFVTAQRTEPHGGPKFFPLPRILIRKKNKKQ